MLALISPAKKLDFDNKWQAPSHTQPRFLDDAQALAQEVKGLSQHELQALMKLSDPLGLLNHTRYQEFHTPFTPDNARPAALAFRGDTYVGLDADSLHDDDLTYAQDHLAILSGLYGLLRPLDLMQAYRLEMGTKFKNTRGKDLYAFWGSKITDACNKITEQHQNRSIICLASNEYIKAIQPKSLHGDYIVCDFKEIKGGEPKTIGLFAKRARGAMARYMIENRIETPEDLKDFDADGYAFDATLSTPAKFVFTRQSA